MEMNERNEGLAISFWTSLIGVALAAFAASAFLVWGRSEFVGWLIFATTPAFFSLQISSIAAGMIERKSKSGKVAMAIAMASTGLVFGLAFFRPFRYMFFSRFAWPSFVSVPVISILGGAIAVDLKNRQMKPLKPMLIIGLMAFILVTWPVVHLLLKKPHTLLGQLPLDVFLILLGPWVMLIIDRSDFDTTRGFFELPFALWLTFVNATISVMMLKAKEPRHAAVLLIIFAAILLCWFSIGATGLIMWGIRLG